MAVSEIKKVFQLGIVVDDALAAAQSACELFALDPESIQYVDLSEYAAPVLYKGQETRSYLKLAMVNVAGLEFEFIQFVGGDANSHKDFYDKNGPGLQHICVAVDDYAGAVKRMEELGAVPLIEGGSDETGYYKYMDMRAQNGLIIELYDEKLSGSKAM